MILSTNFDGFYILRQFLLLWQNVKRNPFANVNSFLTYFVENFFAMWIGQIQLKPTYELVTYKSVLIELALFKCKKKRSYFQIYAFCYFDFCNNRKNSFWINKNGFNCLKWLCVIWYTEPYFFWLIIYQLNLDLCGAKKSLWFSQTQGEVAWCMHVSFVPLWSKIPMLLPKGSIPILKRGWLRHFPLSFFQWNGCLWIGKQRGR